MSKIEVLVFNDHGIGHMVNVPEFPKAGETIRASEWHFGEDAGKGTNVAVALGRQGVPCALICKVGDDSEGHLGEKWLLEAGCDTSHFFMDPALITNRGVVITRADGENMIISNALHDCYMTAEEACAAIDDYPDAKYFLTGFEIGTAESIAACRHAREKGLVTMLNPSPLGEGGYDTFDYVDYLFINEKEAAQLAGAEADASYEEMARKVKEKYDPAMVVMTMGGDGSLLWDGETLTTFSSRKTDVVETAGAGDGFMAAFAAAKTWGCTDEEASEWANLYSAVTVSRKGIILTYPTLEDVKAEEGEHPVL